MKHQRFVFREVEGRMLFEIFVGSSILAKGERVKGAPLAAPWRRRLGRYEVTNPGAFPWLKGATLLYDEDTHLLLADLPAYSARTITPLRPLNESEAILMGSGPGAGETLSFKVVNGEERLGYSGYELRRVR